MLAKNTMIHLVEIVILNWNGLKDTIECLESLQKVKLPSYKILVVDNGSEENEAELIKNRFNDYVETLKTPINLGFGGGNNLALEEIFKREEIPAFVVFLNNDTTVDSNFLRELVEVAMLDEKIAIVGSTIFDYYTKRLIFSGGRIDSKLKIVFDQKQISDKKYFFSEIFSGACFLMKTKYIKDYNLYFDKDLFLYGEEIDLAYRIKKLNLKIAIAHFSRVYHKESQSLGKGLNYLKVYYNVRNRVLLAKKHLSVRERLFFYLFFLISRTIRGIQFLFQRRIDLLKGNFRGIKDGFLKKSGKVI